MEANRQSLPPNLAQTPCGNRSGEYCPLNVPDQYRHWHYVQVSCEERAGVSHLKPTATSQLEADASWRFLGLPETAMSLK